MNRSTLVASLVLALAGLAPLGFAACGSQADTETSDASLPGDAAMDAFTELDGSRADADAQVAPAWGLDERPANPTCKAVPRPQDAIAVRWNRIFSGAALNLPTAMAQAPGDPQHWYVTQLQGKISRINAATGAVESSFQVPFPVRQDWNGGLTNLAFHPSFAQNGRLFLHLNQTGGATGTQTMLARLTSADGGATFGQPAPVVGPFDQPLGDHAGGGLAFGPDGYLYVAFGDSGCCDDVAVRGQSKNTFFSKVLRVDVTTPPQAGRTYVVPPSNPFAAGQDGVEPLTFARGFRNPWRLSFDRDRGDLWLGDIGQDTSEEIDRVQAGGNYGWPCREGATPLLAGNAAHCPSSANLIDPIFSYEHVAGATHRSITGGYVYRGNALPELRGKYIYGDYVTKEIWALGENGGGAYLPIQLNKGGPDGSWVSFAEGLDGELYAVDLLGSALYKLERQGTPGVDTFPTKLSDTGCVLPGKPDQPAAGLVPYDVISPLYSDGAEKTRFVALPDGAKATVDANGRMDLPIGSVVEKTFRLGGKAVETRLLMRHSDGAWSGYSYRFRADGSDADLLPGGASTVVGGQTWLFPSRGECLLCHTAAAGRLLGISAPQLRRNVQYASTGRNSDQAVTWEHIGLVPQGALTGFAGKVMSDPAGTGSLEDRARSYLGANCSHCHQPLGGPRGTMDLRLATPFSATNTCNVDATLGNLGVASAKLVSPGSPSTSVISLRAHRRDAYGMPPLGTTKVDTTGAALIDSWITSLTGCPR